MTGVSDWVVDRVAPTLHWACEREGFHTTIHLANYYSLLDPTSGVVARAVVDCIDRDGDLVATAQRELGPREHWQLPLAGLVTDYEGTVAVRLLPSPVPEHPHTYLGTLYFASWWDDSGHVQFSHESNRMLFEGDPQERTYLSPGMRQRGAEEVEVILQNAYFGEAPMPPDEVDVAVLDSAGESVWEACELVPLRSTRRVSLVREPHVSSGEPFAIRVRGRSLNHPFTYVKHASGDFNIHHF